jgi:hypothetical protein
MTAGALASLFATYARRTGARWWIGERPAVREGRMGRAIAEQLGYPSASNDPFATGGMVLLDRRQAAHVLAVAGTTSLAYRDGAPKPQRVGEATAALDEIGDGAMFLSNGRWIADGGGWLGGSALTSATFDCGVIGWDAERAFILWREDED